jgi:HEAT repeat protein
MRNKTWLILLALLSLAIVGVLTNSARNNKSSGSYLSHAADNSNAVCQHESDIHADLLSLSSGNEIESERIRQTLLNTSRKSSECRKQIIVALTEAMDKPNLDFRTQQSNYYLWLEGSRLLGDLKATEALDLLISHLDLNDGVFSASMNDQPAVIGVSKMGAVAVPKLDIALRQNHNRDIRLAAAYCLTEIHDQSAIKALRNALGSESDPCVARYISLSLKIFDRESKSSNIPTVSQDLDTEINARRELLMAFLCNK